MMNRQKKNILVAVLGQTPQIITETLYALMIRRKPPVPISSVYIITTSKGADIAWRTLGGVDGEIARFCREYGIAAHRVAFKYDHIITVNRHSDSRVKAHLPEVNGSAEPLDDIRTSKDNQLLASQLLGFIKGLTEDPQVVLYCSIAGGRKTMSAYMLLALTLYGRECDRLTHVLVHEDFESNPRFFFPPKSNTMLPVRKATGELAIVQTKDANVELGEIPFVRLRSLLGPKFKSIERSVEELINIAQQKIDLSEEAQEKLLIDLRRREAKFGDEPIEISGIKLALLTYYADTKVNHCTEPERPICAECCACFQRAPELDLNRFLELYKSVFTQSPTQFEASSAKLRKGRQLDSNTVMTYNNRINEVIRRVTSSFQIASERHYGNTRYGLSLDKTLIQIIR
ncbi:MAG TPA: CRISPR-associated ring nuclease Csm6 [Pyrinomonadaceae bacterium]|jgi:CRISPR-associated protein (TIGR02584 family)